MRRFLIRVSVLWVFAAGNVLGATPKSLPTVVPAAEVAKATDPVEDIRVKVLRDELQTVKDFTQSMLATVYWSLTTVVVLLVALLGVNWYQNVKVYERDKETMRQQMENAFGQKLLDVRSELDKEVRKRVGAVDETFANALETMARKLEDARLDADVAVFRTSHLGATPRTDFVFLCSSLKRSMDRASNASLREGLSVVVEYLESREAIDGTARTQLLELVSKLPGELAGYGERLRAILGAKT